MKIKYLWLILPILLLAGCQAASQDKAGNLVSQDKDSSVTSTPALPPETVEPVKATSTAKVEAEKPKPETNSEPPKFLDYPVAFASQAPLANWDALHEEACEEAAMIMTAKYFKGEPLSAHLMEQGILNLVKWEEQNGYQVDVTASEAAVILKSYFSLKAEVTSEVTVARIKKELLAGNLIIIPAAGRLLGNPNFKPPGPIYHMLVVRGYDEARGEFITNDPGTRNGAGYRYKYQTLINAVHDWNHELAAGGMTDAEMAQGAKVVIIVSK
ncbi:MAG: C39 family peptidase [Patescibacteria group bacterium]|jgi:hypothetical protein